MPKTSSRKSTPTTSSSPALPEALCFRLDRPALQVLAERAELLELSVHELARHYVIQALSEQEERACLHERLAVLEQGLTATRDDLADTAMALLTSAGKVEPEEAQRWVSEHLNQPCSRSLFP